MRTEKWLSVVGLFGVWLLVGCFDEGGNPAGGRAAGPVYVAIGNSLTAGVQDFGLRRDRQEESYPALLARAMGSHFEQALVDTPGIGLGGQGGGPITPLRPNPFGFPTADTLRADPQSLLINLAWPRAYNNLGVPGLESADPAGDDAHYLSLYTMNPTFRMVLRGYGSQVRQAISLRPDILTVWVGNNDILGGITSGTVELGATVTPSPIFIERISAVLDSLLRKTEAQIFLANIPSITTIPFVTTVPKFVPDINALVLERRLQVLPDSIPLLTEEDSVAYVLFSAAAGLLEGQGIPSGVQTGSPFPMPNIGQALPARFTLSLSEVRLAESLIAEYNEFLERRAGEESRITLVDAHGLLERLNAGQLPGLSSGYISLDPQSAFSLDAVHPNSRGYREIARLFLESINSKLGKNFQLP